MMILGLACLPFLGATVGGTVLAGLTGGVMDGLLAFGVAALLYLVTEELLVEAHKAPDGPWITSLFFVGFLLLLTISMLV